MKTYLVWLAIAMVFVLSNGYAVADGPFTRLTLEMSADRTQCAQYLPICVTVTLRNGTDQIVKANKQLSQDTSLSLFMIGPNGKKQKLVCFPEGDIRPGPLPADIGPKEIVTRRILVPYTYVEETGNYRLWAHFEDWDRSAAIESKPIEVQVVAAPDREGEAIAFLKNHNLLRLLSLCHTPLDLTEQDVQHMHEFLKSAYDRSQFVPYIKGKRGQLLAEKYLAAPSSDEMFGRGLDLLEEAANTVGYAEAPGALFKLGLLYEKKAEYAKAKVALSAVVARWPMSEQARSARISLDAISRRSAKERN